jgi:hypothetical protein
VVPEWIAETYVDSIGLLDWFLGKLDSFGYQRLIGLFAVVCGETDCETGCAFCD